MSLVNDNFFFGANKGGSGVSRSGIPPKKNCQSGDAHHWKCQSYITIVYFYFIFLLYIFIVYLYRISISYIFIVYLYRISLSYIYIVYLYFISILYIFIVYLYRISISYISIILINSIYVLFLEINNYFLVRAHNRTNIIYDFVHSDELFIFI